jgi:hypothetical protein
MKIFDTRIIVLFLVIVFLIVNFIFLLKYIHSQGNENLLNGENSNSQDDIETEVKYLQKIVDFNNTTFENNGLVHFYNAAYQKVAWSKNHLHNSELRNITYNDRYNLNQKYFYDHETGLFVDTKLNFCRQIKFDYYNLTCAEDKIKFINVKSDSYGLNYLNNLLDTAQSENEILIYNCNENIKCCEKEYECLYKCFEDLRIYLDDSTKSEIIYHKCRKLCVIKINMKSYELPNCYLSDEFDANINTTVILSDV